jgi:hypothetical protein
MRPESLAGARLATIGWDRKLRLWDLETRTLLREFALQERPDVVAAAGGIVVLGTEQGTVPGRVGCWTASAPITTLAARGAPDGEASVIAGDAGGAVHQLRIRA